MSRYLLPRFHDLVFIVLFIGAILTGPRMLNTDGDLGRHITLGNYILDSSRIPTTNLLSFTKPNQPRPPYEWLAQVIFSTINRLLNLDGVVVLTALVIGLAFVVVYFDSVHRSNMPVVALLLTLFSAAASSLHWLSRPHIFSFLFFAIWIKWLDELRNNNKISLWLFPALMLVWTNTHGGFVYGELAWTAYLAGWIWEWLRKTADNKLGKNLIIVGASSLFASVLTPDLWHNWQSVFNNSDTYILSHTAETLPPSISVHATLPFFVLLILSTTLFIYMLFAFRKNLIASQFLLLAGFGFMSLMMARNIPFFVISAAPILSEWMKKSLDNVQIWLKLETGFSKIDISFKGFIWSILILIMAIGLVFYHQIKYKSSINSFNPKVFPVQAVDWIVSHPLKGNMFNDFNWGGYLLYRLWPGKLVFIDSQSDFYGEELTRHYAQILNGDGSWEQELSQYKVSWIIVSPQAGLAKASIASPNWELVYEDLVAVIYVRR